MHSKQERQIRWGDIYYCDLGTGKGSVQSKLRPVLIVQNNVGNENGPTTVVAAISSVIKKMYLPTHVLLDADCGLTERSIVMLEQIRTVDRKTELKEYVGNISSKETIAKIKKGLAIEMGVMEIPKRQEQTLSLSLCAKCRNAFLRDPGYVLRRCNHLQIEKERCDICQTACGFEYIIKRRRRKATANF